MAPIVVKDKVLVGNSRRRDGRARVADGARRETAARSLGGPTTPDPTKMFLSDRDFKPFYATDRGKDLGVKSWPPDQWKIGGGGRLGLDLLRSRSKSDLSTARRIPGRGIPTSGRATTNGPAASSRAIPTPARPSGSISGVRMTSTIGTASTNKFCSIWI